MLGEEGVVVVLDGGMGGGGHLALLIQCTVIKCGWRPPPGPCALSAGVGSKSVQLPELSVVFLATLSQHNTSQS